MRHSPGALQYLMSAGFLMLAGWGGLALMVGVFQLPPVVWARWGFFVLLFLALTGTALPAAYFLNLRFPSVPRAGAHTHVRQAMWTGVYGCLVAWLQLGRVMAFWIWVGLAGGLIAVEYLVRLRERARWSPPISARREQPEMHEPGAESSMDGNGLS